MNTYKYEFSYKPLSEIEENEEKGRLLNERTGYDFSGINIAIHDHPNFPELDRCYYDPNNEKIIFIESKQPASVFDDIVKDFCKDSNGKYIAHRID